MEWQIASARAAGISEIAIARGFQAEKMPFEDVHYFINPRYASTNMVETLKMRSIFLDRWVYRLLLGYRFGA